MKLGEGKRNVLLLGAGLLVGTGLGLIILLVFVGGFLPGGRSEGFRDGVSLPAPSVGSPAPGFTIETLAGDTVALEDYHGRPALINFWATWCAPCRLEMPVFEKIHKEGSGELAVLAVNYAEKDETVSQYVQELGLTFPILMDRDGSVQRLYHIRGYPTTLFIDREGIIRVYHVGIVSEKQLERYMADLGAGK